MVLSWTCLIDKDEQGCFVLTHHQCLGKTDVAFLSQFRPDGNTCDIMPLHSPSMTISRMRHSASSHVRRPRASNINTPKYELLFCSLLLNNIFRATCRLGPSCRASLLCYTVSIADSCFWDRSRCRERWPFMPRFRPA